MAITYRLSGSADWTNTTYWSGAAAPVATNDVQVDAGADIIITNLPGVGSGVNYNSIVIGPNFTGKLGSSSARLNIGTVGTILFEGTRCGECWIGVDTTDVLTNLVIKGATNGNDAFVLYTSLGTTTNFRHLGPGHARIAGSTLVTNVRVSHPSASLTIDSAASVTTAYCNAGVVNCEAAVTTLHLNGGTWNHDGTATYNITTLNVNAGQFNWSAYDTAATPTITTLNIDGGTVDLNFGNQYARTVTTLNGGGGKLLNRYTAPLLTVGTSNIWGTQIVS